MIALHILRLLKWEVTHTLSNSLNHFDLKEVSKKIYFFTLT